jgi:hypothetical protein
MTKFHDQDFIGLVPLSSKLRDSVAIADIEEIVESRLREAGKDLAALIDLVQLQDLARLRRYRQAQHFLNEAVRAVKGEQ